MPRISNKVIYNQDATPNLKDYVIGTDINDFKRTKNYNLKSIFNLFNNANGVSNNLYKFSLVEDEENYLTPGVLSLESTNLNGVFTIYLNKENTEGTNLSVLFAKMDEGFSGRHHKLRLESASDKNFFINLNIRDMISYADYISIEVELSDAGSIGDLIQESFYVVSFIVDEAHYEISQQIKLDDTEGNIDQLVTSAINKLPRFYVKPNETRSVFVDFVSGNSLYRKHWRLRYSGRYYGVGHPISYHSHIKVDHVEILVQNISNQGNIVDLGEIGSPPLDNEGNPISRELHLSNYINRLGTSITLKLGNVVTALFNTEEYNFYFNGDEALYGINDEETVEENFNEFDSEEVPIDVEVNNGVESYYISPEPTPQTENFFIDVIVADNINNRAQQIPQSSKLIYIYTLFQYGGQSFRKIWVLDNSNRAYGQGTPPIGAGNLIEFNTQALQQNSVVDLGDIGALVGDETYEEHLRDYINAQDPSIGLINSGTIRADFGGDIREFNFSNVTGDYGLNVNQTEVTDFQLYGESNNEEDAGTIVTNTSQLVNDGEDGSSRFVEEDELGTIAYEDSNQFIKQQEREIPNGIATLDGAGKLKTDQIPDLAITDVVTPTETTIEAFVANNDNYTYQQGDVIVIDDGSGDVTHNMYKGGDKSLVTSYSEINATEFAISQINGLQGELDNRLKKTGETSQTIVSEVIVDNSSFNKHLKIKRGSETVSLTLSPTGDLYFLTNNSIRATINKLNGNMGVGTNSPVEKLDVAGNVKADKHITNGGDGTNLIDGNGDLVPKSTFAETIHNHEISQINNLQTELGNRFNLLSDSVSGYNLVKLSEIASPHTYDFNSFTIINTYGAVPSDNFLTNRLKPNTQYTFSYKSELLSGSVSNSVTGQIRLSFSNPNQVIQLGVGGLGFKQGKFTTPSSYTDVSVFTYGGSTSGSEVKFSNFTLTEGNVFRKWEASALDLIDNAVQKTGETSQNVAGTLSADKHKTNGGDGTNLIDDNGDLVPKSTFATSADKDIYNLIIGGVGGTITSKALLASKFTFTESEVLLFKVFNNDVYAYINVEYNLNTSAFNADNNITYFIDKGKLINTGNQSFLNATNLEYFEAKNIELIDNNTFRGCTSLTFDNIKVINVKTINGVNTFRSILGGGLLYVPFLTSINGVTSLETFRFTSINEIYAPKLEQLGDDALDNDLFFGLTGNPKITLHYSLRFNNNGGKDGDIVVAENAGANIVYANVPNIATVTADTLTELDLTNPNGNFCNHSSANSTETYTILNSIAGNKTEILVNAVNEPTITGATKVSSDLFISNTDIYMIVEVKPHRVEYYFKQI